MNIPIKKGLLRFCSQRSIFLKNILEKQRWQMWSNYGVELLNVEDETIMNFNRATPEQSTNCGKTVITLSLALVYFIFPAGTTKCGDLLGFMNTLSEKILAEKNMVEWKLVVTHGYDYSNGYTHRTSLEGQYDLTFIFGEND